MKKKNINNLKLGLFVLAGLFFLVLLLYMIGRNRNLFGSNFPLKSRFENVQGLVAGNNVRYAGISVGTVKSVKIVNDTLIEVTMLIDDNMKEVIRTNTIASIGTDGLMGNKLVNLIPARTTAQYVNEGCILVSSKPIDTDDMLHTLYKTNTDIGIVAENLKRTVKQINSSKTLWTILNDEELPRSIRTSLANIRVATGRAGEMINDLQIIISDVKDGKGSLGAVLRDSTFATDLRIAIEKIKMVGDHANDLALRLDSTVRGISYQVNDGKGTVRALLKDSAIVKKLNKSLDNIQEGTDAFNANMEALKHNFLFRGYFRKLEKEKQRQNKQEIVID